MTVGSGSHRYIVAPPVFVYTMRQRAVVMNQNQPVSPLPEKRSKLWHKLVNVLYVILIILLCVIPAIEQITTVTLTCNRAVPAGPVSCTVQKSLFSVLPLGHFEIPDVRGAKVSQSMDPDGDLSQRIELFT